MRSKEFILGADLYIKAIEADLPNLLNKDPKYGSLKEALRVMAVPLLDLDIISNRRIKGPNNTFVRKPRMHVPATQNIDPIDHVAFLPRYNNVLEEFKAVGPDLEADGQSSFLDYLDQTHIAPLQSQSEPQTITQIYPEDMKTVISSGLELLEAVREDPANTAFVKGLDTASIDSLWSTLEDAGYLMPGENPDRTKSIGDQDLRGTPEEQQAILNEITSLSNGLVLPNEISMSESNGPTLAAFKLTKSVENIRTEQITIDDHDFGPKIGQASDLTPKDAKALANYLMASNDMLMHAQYDPERITHIVVPEPYVKSVQRSLAVIEDYCIKDALGTGDFEAPGINPAMAIRLKKSIETAQDAVDPDRELTEYTGDDAAEVNSSGGMLDEANSLDNAFDQPAQETTGDISDNYVHSLSREVMADEFVGSDNLVAIKMDLADEIETVTTQLVENGALSSLFEHAGIAPKALQIEKAAFGTKEEALGMDGVMTIDETNVRISSAMSKQALQNMGSERRAKLKYVIADRNSGPFKGMEPSTPHTAAIRVNRHIRDTMIKEDGTPNHHLRDWLKRASTGVIVADSEAEAIALKKEAIAFAKREREEHQNRKIAVKDENVSTAKINTNDAMRMVHVMETAGNNEPIRVTINEDNSVTLFNEQAPMITTKLDKVSEPIKSFNHDQSARQIGGFITKEELRAAVELGPKNIELKLNAETPIRVSAAMQKEPVKTKVQKYDDITLS